MRIEHRVVPRLVDLLEIACSKNAGVVDQDVDLSERRSRSGRDPGTAFNIGDNDLRATRSQAERMGPADAPSGAGHQGGAPVERDSWLRFSHRLLLEAGLGSFDSGREVISVEACPSSAAHCDQ
jgi:hypothetical protein